jgi:hypothetical protein
MKPLLSRSKTLCRNTISIESFRQARFGVADLESFSDFLLGIRVLHLSCHHGKEFYHDINTDVQLLTPEHKSKRTGEINGAIVISVNLVDHILQLGLGRVLAQGAHNGAQFLGGNLSCRKTISLILHNISSSAPPFTMSQEALVNTEV